MFTYTCYISDISTYPVTSMISTIVLNLSLRSCVGIGLSRRPGLSNTQTRSLVII